MKVLQQGPNLGRWTNVSGLPHPVCLLLLLVIGVGQGIHAPPRASGQSTDSNAIDFNAQVRPILAAKCLACHGPDEEDRQADLRLDTFAGATEFAIVPGDAANSEVMLRIVSEDDDLVMPPVDSGKKALDKQEQAILRRWIEQGANYAQHWSFVPPTQQPIPAGKGSHPVDAFIRERLQKSGLQLNPSASREVLARRVALDLTGLPPSPTQLKSFLNDQRPDAYEHYVDGLLETTAFGEHWASYWLDLARYADTDGYADDYPRTIWPYRDWVIQAINDDKPFDRFTIEQLAGDLIPDANDRTRVATGFHRNTLTNNEGGTIDEEFRVAAVKDRVDTTMQVWNGLTFGCAKCHSHKYDPISQHDYYQMFAVFNQTADNDRPGNPPFQKTYSQSVADEAQHLQAEITALNQTNGKDSPEFQAAFAAWQKTWDQPPQAWHGVEIEKASAANGSQVATGESEIQVDGDSPAMETLELEATPVAKPDASSLSALRLRVHPRGEAKVVGRSPGNGNFVISEVQLFVRQASGTVPNVKTVRLDLPGEKKMIHLAEVQLFDKNHQLIPRSAIESLRQSSTDFGGEVERLADGNTDGAFENESVSHTAVEANPWVEIQLKQPQALSDLVLHSRTDNQLHRRLDGLEVKLLDAEKKTLWSHRIEEASAKPMTFYPGDWQPVRFDYASADFEQSEGGKVEWNAQRMIDGDEGRKGWAVSPRQNQPHQAILQLLQPLRVDDQTRLKLRIVQNYGQQHTIANLTWEWTDYQGINLAVPLDQQFAEDVFLRSHPLGNQRERQLAELNQKLESLEFANTPIMQELPNDQHRETHLLVKGSWLSPGERVHSALPAYFVSQPTESAQPAARTDRLELAQWLVSDSNPLTARVTVNRIWARLFGRGIVETEEDFGMMGSVPTHPELLDWMAVHFRDELGWSRKALIRFLVTSDTYRQTATVTPTHGKQDPENRLLARAPRFRLSAEQVRDQALMVGGLLNREMYGPSVVPRLPVQELGSAFSGRTIRESSGDDLYRRGLYTFVRRTGPYPTVLTFDGTNRQVCTVRRIRTNTPLQALVTLNDPVFFEAAQGFSRRIAEQALQRVESAQAPPIAELAATVKWAFQQATCRPPTDAETDQLVLLYQQQVAQFQSAGVPGSLLTDPIGPLPEHLSELSPESLAAWTVVANVLLNLDEVLTR